MKVKELLPIGTIVMLNEGTKKLMIAGIKQTEQETLVEYDYTGVMYPEGMIGELGQFLFNHSDIKEVYFKGFENEERDEFLDKLEEFYENQQN